MSRREPSTGVWFFVAHRAMEQRILDGLHAAGFDEVTVAQSRLFARVDPAGTRLTDLAERALVTKQTAQVLVNHLEEAGYVERVADPTDARARLIRPAARGRRALRHARRLEQRIEAEWEQHLGADDMAHLRRTMVRLREITDPFA